VAAAFSQKEVDQLQAYDTAKEFYVPADKDTPGFAGIFSPMLTVWRKLHLEIDSMAGGPPSTGAETNYLMGTVAGYQENSPTSGLSTLRLEPDIRISQRIAMLIFYMNFKVDRTRRSIAIPIGKMPYLAHITVPYPKSCPFLDPPAGRIIKIPKRYRSRSRSL